MLSEPFGLLVALNQQLLVVLDQVMALDSEGPKLLDANQQQVVVRVLGLSLLQQGLWNTHAHTHTQACSRWSSWSFSLLQVRVLFLDSPAAAAGTLGSSALAGGADCGAMVCFRRQ